MIRWPSGRAGAQRVLHGSHIVVAHILQARLRFDACDGRMNILFRRDAYHREAISENAAMPSLRDASAALAADRGRLAAAAR